MKLGKGKLFFFLSILVSFYFVFRTLFFILFGNCSVDILIGFTIFFLFFLIYKKSRLFFYNYMWNLTKNLYLNFFSLFKLLVSFRKLVLGYNKVYLEYFRYSFFALKIISKSFSVIFNNLSLNLLNKFLINFFLNKLNLKLFFVNNRVSFLPVEYVIRSNSNYELNIFLSYDVLFFII